MSDLHNAIDDAKKRASEIIETAINATANDPGAPLEMEVIEALAAVKSESPAQYLRHRQAIKKASRDVLLSELDRLVKRASGDDGSDEQGSIADVLVSMASEKAKLFIDGSNEAFASFDHDGHRETWALQSKGFKEWLSFAFYHEYGKAPREASIKDALNTLSGIATHAGEQHEVYLRCAPNPVGAGYIIDLCDDQWRVIEVTPNGWSVLDKSPVRFKRTPNMKPLPTPEAGGKVNDLWQFANITPENRGLVIAWMLEAFRPDTPFPVLEIGGEQGSAKSSTQSWLRDFIDPSAINLRAAPKTVEDVFVSAARNWLASMNNMSHLSAPVQDALCTLATGGGYGGRKLFTNDDEAVWETKRPVIINGISTLVTAPDLLDRTIRTESPKITTYISESELRAGFEEKRTGIFGALLDVFSKALAILPDVTIDQPPRMTDFAHFGEAVYRAVGKKPGQFLSDYRKGREAAVMQSIESSPVAGAVIELTERGDFKGTVGDLLDRLSNYKPHSDTGWPKSAKGLSDILKRYAPPLRIVGVSVEFDGRGNRGRMVRVCYHPQGVEAAELTVTTSATVTKSPKSDVGDVGDDEIHGFDTPPLSGDTPKRETREPEWEVF